MLPSTYGPTRTSGVVCAPTVPGLHLVVEVAGLRALLAADLVVEVVRLVALAAVPGAAPPVAGVFVHRGEDVVAFDLAACLGVPREPDLDAHVIVLRTPRRIGLVVDAVRSIVDGVTPLPARPDARWAAAGLAAGVVRTAGGHEAPLLRVDGLVTRAMGLPVRGDEASR